MCMCVLSTEGLVSRQQSIFLVLRHGFAVSQHQKNWLLPQHQPFCASHTHAHILATPKMSRDWQNSLCDWRHSLSSIRDTIMYYFFNMGSFKCVHSPNLAYKLGSGEWFDKRFEIYPNHPLILHSQMHRRQSWSIDSQNKMTVFRYIMISANHRWNIYMMI